ncbi:MAG: hypothetical protein ACTSPI_13870 [Candidatus Heimdallarchaeaceae archaeon]
MLQTIQAEKLEFENKPIQIVNGFMFNQKETIEKIYLYYNSKFISGDEDVEGQKKYFFNIVRNPCKVTTKAIDFDTKNINVQTAAGGDPLKTWYFERDLKFWMKKQAFGSVLNRIFFELPIFGSVVLKIVNNKPEFVDLRNFIVEKSADTLNQANYIIEKHLYTPMEFQKIGKELGWNKIDEAIEQYRKMEGAPYIAVYERYGEEVKENAKGKKTYEYRRTYVADVGVDEVDEKTGNISKHEGIELKSDVIDKHPYWEFHMEKIAGRWLGVGVVETLFDPQIRENEVANLQSKALYWAALQVWQSRDSGVNRNLLTEMVNGEILTTESEITKIDVVDRNLANYNQEADKWMKNRDELTFSYEVISGERLPAGTPLGSARLAAGMASGYFDQIRENIALRLKELLFDVIIPNFEKENKTEHILRLVGEDLDKIRELIIRQKAKNEFFRFVFRKGKIPRKIQYDLMKMGIEEKANQGKEVIIKIPKGYYDNIKYDISIDIVGEGEAEDSILWAILQAITVDPTILQDPRKKKLFYMILEKKGFNPMNLEPDVSRSVTEQMTEASPEVATRVGGGVSRPAPLAGAAQTERTL